MIFHHGVIDEQGESFRLLNSEIGNDPIKYQNGIRMGVTSIK